MSTSYRAVIKLPQSELQKLQPDEYGTVTVPAAPVLHANNPVPLNAWAAEVLGKCPAGSTCEIHRMEDEIIETITQAQAEEMREVKHA